MASRSASPERFPKSPRPGSGDSSLQQQSLRHRHVSANRSLASSPLQLVIEPLVDRRSSTNSNVSIPPPKDGTPWTSPGGGENVATIPINGSIGFPASHGRRRSVSSAATSPKATPLQISGYGSNQISPIVESQFANYPETNNNIDIDTNGGNIGLDAALTGQFGLGIATEQQPTFRFPPINTITSKMNSKFNNFNSYDSPVAMYSKSSFSLKRNIPSKLPAIQLVEPSATELDEPNNTNVMGYVNDINPSATTQESFVTTHLVASYKWTITNFHSITDEKIVSPPFGSSEHPWQMVVYPRGTAGSDHTFLSAFLRPLKTRLEILQGDDWFRPVKRFVIRVHKPDFSSAQYSEVPTTEPIESFSYTIAPTHQSDIPAEDILLQDSSVESEFSGFAASVPGWGFTNLMDLNEYLTAAVDPQTGNMILSVSVESLPTVSCTTQSFSWGISDLSNIFSQCTPELVSPSFGPESNSWCIHLVPDYEGRFIAAYLQPVLSNVESSRRVWSRSISSFTIRIAKMDSSGSYGYSAGPAYFASKTLTGGFVFDSLSLSTGWANVVGMDQLLEGFGDLRVDVEVTWVSGVSMDLEDVRTPEKPGVSEKEVSEQLQIADAKWEAKVGEVSKERDLMRIRVSALEKDLAAGKEKIKAEGFVANELRAELSAARLVQERVAHADEMVKIVKARVAALRASMDEDPLSEMKNDSYKGTQIESEMNGKFESTVYTTEIREEQFFVMKSKVLTLEADLASAQEALRAYRAKEIDSKLGVDQRSGRNRSPSVNRRASIANDAGDGSLSVDAAIEAANEEMESARELLNNFTTRSAFSYDVAEQSVEKAAARADLSMVCAELNLAQAALLDAAFHKEPHNLPTNNPDSQVASISYQIDQLLKNFETQLSYLKPTANETTFSYENGISMIGVNGSVEQQSFTNGTGYDSQYPGNNNKPQLPYHQVGGSGSGGSVDARVHELEVQIERERTRAEIAMSELETYHRLEAIKAKGGYPGSPTFRGSIMTSPTLKKGVIPRPLGRGDIMPGAWTPVDEGSGPVSAAELAKLLSTIQPATSKPILSSLFFSTFLALTSFITYATLHIHCANQLNQQTLICETSVPIYTSIATAWHKAADRFVSEIVPATAQALNGATSSTWNVIDLFEQKVAAQWERAERERVERMQREKEKWEFEKAAIAERQRVERLEEVERAKKLELELREKEILEKAEAERIKLEAKVKEIEELRMVERLKVEKELADWLAVEREKGLAKLLVDQRAAEERFELEKNSRLKEIEQLEAAKTAAADNAARERAIQEKAAANAYKKAADERAAVEAALADKEKKSAADNSRKETEKQLPDQFKDPVQFEPNRNSVKQINPDKQNISEPTMTSPPPSPLETKLTISQNESEAVRVGSEGKSTTNLTPTPLTEPTSVTPKPEITIESTKTASTAYSSVTKSTTANVSPSPLITNSDPNAPVVNKPSEPSSSSTTPTTQIIATSSTTTMQPTTSIIAPSQPPNSPVPINNSTITELPPTAAASKRLTKVSGISTTDVEAVIVTSSTSSIGNGDGDAVVTKVVNGDIAGGQASGVGRSRAPVVAPRVSIPPKGSGKSGAVGVGEGGQDNVAAFFVNESKPASSGGGGNSGGDEEEQNTGESVIGEFERGTGQSDAIGSLKGVSEVPGEDSGSVGDDSERVVVDRFGRVKAREGGGLKKGSESTGRLESGDAVIGVA